MGAEWVCDLDTDLDAALRRSVTGQKVCAGLLPAVFGAKPSQLSGIA